MQNRGISKSRPRQWTVPSKRFAVLVPVFQKVRSLGLDRSPLPILSPVNAVLKSLGDAVLLTGLQCQARGGGGGDASLSQGSNRDQSQDQNRKRKSNGRGKSNQKARKTGEEDHRGEDSGSDENPGKPAPNKSGPKASGQDPSSHLMCPYFKHSPDRYKHKSCANPKGWQNISRLKYVLFKIQAPKRYLLTV